MHTKRLYLKFIIMAYSLISDTPFDFEFRFEKSIFSGSSCSFFCEGRECRERIYDINEKSHHALRSIFSIARDFEDMICSLSEEDIRFIDSKLFHQISKTFEYLYTDYPENFVDTDKKVKDLILEEYRDFTIGDDVVHGLPTKLKFNGTTLAITFCIKYDAVRYIPTEKTLHVDVPPSFSKIVKISRASKFLHFIRTHEPLLLYRFYINAGWSTILGDVYWHSSRVPGKIINKLPKDIIDNDIFFGYWKLQNKQIMDNI